MDISSISQATLNRVVAFLSSIFLPACNGDQAQAEAAAMEVLAEYNPRTNRELRFAALSLAFSLGALDALAQAANPERTINQVLRLRSSANALNRSAQRAERALAEERETPQADSDDDAVLPDTTEPLVMAAFNRASPPLSRQQRRKQEQEAERRRRKAERFNHTSPAPHRNGSRVAAAV